MQLPDEPCSTDIMAAEFGALVDSFLGTDFDPVKRRKIEELQIAANKQQAELYNRTHAGELSEEEYVDECNLLFEQTLKGCESVLGAQDFQKLFGISPQETSRLIEEKVLLLPIRIDSPLSRT